MKSLFGKMFIYVVLALIIVYSIVNLTIAQIRLAQNKQELAELESEKQELQLTKQELQAMLDEDSYDALLERALRENGYVRSDEKVYTDITGN